jgi:hypothetical protein
VGKGRVPQILPTIKGNAGHPDYFMSFDVETVPLGCLHHGYDNPDECEPCKRTNGLLDEVLTIDDQEQTLKMGWAVFGRLKTKGEKLEKCFFTTADEFWDFVEEYTRDNRVLWLVNHNIFFDLQNVKWNESLVDRGWHADTCVVPPGPFMVVFKRGKQTIKMVNLANWWGHAFSQVHR